VLSLPRASAQLLLKDLGTSQDVQVLDDSAAAEIEKIFLDASIAGLPSLPSANMSQCMLNGYPFAQLGSSNCRWRKNSRKT